MNRYNYSNDWKKPEAYAYTPNLAKANTWQEYISEDGKHGAIAFNKLGNPEIILIEGIIASSPININKILQDECERWIKNQNEMIDYAKQHPEMRLEDIPMVFEEERKRAIEQRYFEATGERLP